MDFFQLKYFKAVADTGSFTRAAETLMMTQSALSRSIARLEDELGVRLFEREGNHIILNRYGEHFLRDATQMLCSMTDCTRAVREMAGLEQGDVIVGISKDVYLDHLIRHFLLEYPGVSFHCYLLDTEQMREGLRNGAVDFVVTTQVLEEPDLVTEELYFDWLEVVMNAKHPLANQKEIRLSQLEEEQFVVSNSNYKMENVVQQLCGRAGFVPKILYEGTSTDMPMYFIANNTAIMITPHSINAGVVQSAGMDPARFDPGFGRLSHIRLVDEYEGIRKPVRLIRKKGHYQSAPAQKFQERVVEFYRSIGSDLDNS